LDGRVVYKGGGDGRNDKGKRSEEGVIGVLVADQSRSSNSGRGLEGLVGLGLGGSVSATGANSASIRTWSPTNLDLNITG
jgi:hypothetical protein